MRVATFNAHHGRPWRGFASNRWLARAIARLDVDVLGVQELERKVVRSGFADQPAVDVLLTPTVAARPRRTGALDKGGTVRQALKAMPMIAYTALWNVAGNPAASVPAGLADDGLPLAVQLVGRVGDETTLISLAAQLEQARPWPLITAGA